MDNKLISWDDYSSTTRDSDYELTNIACPVCGAPLRRYIRVVLTTYPEQYRYDCANCNWTGIKGKYYGN